jgi:hypothetical protein
MPAAYAADETVIIRKPVPDVRQKGHAEALEVLNSAGFLNVSCDGNTAHHTHSTGRILAQGCMCAPGSMNWGCWEPMTLDTNDMVYLSFSPKP